MQEKQFWPTVPLQICFKYEKRKRKVFSFQPKTYIMRQNQKHTKTIRIKTIRQNHILFQILKMIN